MLCLCPILIDAPKGIWAQVDYKNAIKHTFPELFLFWIEIDRIRCFHHTHFQFTRLYTKLTAFTIEYTHRLFIDPELVRDRDQSGHVSDRPGGINSDRDEWRREAGDQSRFGACLSIVH